MNPARMLSALIFSAASAPAELTLQSGPAQTHLLELYTSEGCSSCPPAEKWFSGLKQNPRLWKEIVPVCFHVDYWDRLGWPDRFASKEFTGRQYRHAAASGRPGYVYTPGFVLDGREWKERSAEKIVAPGGNAGVLTAALRERKGVAVAYRPPHTGNWEAHVAVLGFGLSSDVKAGENSGHKLKHDFVVLALSSKAMTEKGDAHRVEMPLPETKSGGESGLAVWITKTGEAQPVQAVGGFLP